MKIFNLLLVLALLLSTTHSMAQLPSQQRGWRKLASFTEAVGGFLAPRRWRDTLVGMTVASSLLLSLPVVAQELRPVGHYTQASRAEHLSVFNLLLNFAQTWRDNHIVYVGQRGDHSLFLGLRLGITVIPIAEAELMLGAADAWLFDHEGLVSHSVAVEEIQAFLRPDANLVRLYDITLLAIEGLDMHDYRAVQLDAFPSPERPLEIVSYRVDLVEEKEEWVEVLSKAPLAREGCTAFGITPEMWSAHGNCGIDGIVSATAPIFNAAGKLVGFIIHKGDMVVIPPQVKAYLEEALAVAPGQKLSITWGAIKQGGY